MLDLSFASELVSRSKKVIVGGVNSPIRSFADVPVDPLIISHGKGASICDVEGRCYTDYCMSWGALILGHAYPSVVARVQERVAAGSSFGITTEEEIEIAERLVALIPSVDTVRFVSSGTEATMTAARIARGYTGREYIVKFDGNYHGHADLFLVKAGSGATSLQSDSFSTGVPRAVIEKTISIPYNSPERVAEVFAKYPGQIAAVIVEPIAGNMGLIPSTPEFLKVLRSETEKDGALLLFDEVISGFRVGVQGAQGIYGITPDLTTFGKVVAGGFPAAAIGGRREVMEVLAPIGSVYQAGTLSGNPVAMVAGLATLEELQDGLAYIELEEKGRRLEEGLKPILRSGVLSRVGSMFTLFFSKARPKTQADLQQVDVFRFTEYFQHMLASGIYVPQSPFECAFLSLSHTDEDIDRFVEAVARFEEV